jgi:hypothetical protein
MAITTKARAKGLLRDARALLADKTLPKELHDALGLVQTALAKKWSDLAAEADTDTDDVSEAGAFSFDDVRQMLQAAVRATFSDKETYTWVRDVYDTWFVYEVESRQEINPGTSMFRRSYVIDEKGAVTMGEPEAVLRATIYVPVSEAGFFETAVSQNDRLSERKMDKSVGGGVDRDKIPAADFAGKNRSFPIVTPGDVADAAAAIGRAGADNYSTDELKRRIIAIAKRKGESFVAKLPKAWQEGVQEAGDRGQESELIGEIVPLVEKAVRADGTAPIKMIQPGWGSSGYYSAELLKRDGPKAFPAGTQMFWDHATPTEEAERPEGSLARLAAVTVKAPVFQEKGPAGPGLYSEAKVFGQYAAALEELAPHIGVSIRGQGVVRAGEAEGRKGLIVEKLLPGRSVDFVTTPGAGGQVVAVFEAARDSSTALRSAQKGGTGMDEKEIKALQEAKQAADAEVARLREALLLREARDAAAAELAKIEMPELTRTRLAEVLGARPAVKEGKLDLEAFKARISEAAKDELAYLAGVGRFGGGLITGMGARSETGQSTGDVNKLVEAMQRLGLSEAAAKAAAAGR